MKKCVVLGGGGHAKGVIDAILLSGGRPPAAVTDPDRSLGKVLEVPVVGGDDELPRLMKRGVAHFVVGLGGAPGTRPRAKLFLKALEMGLRPLTVVHPKASVAKSAALGEGTVVLAMAAVNPLAWVGRNAIINTGALVEHDAHVGDHAHLAPGSRLLGGVRVGEGAFVGAGAVVKEGVRIGAWSVVGAGAVVLRDVPDKATVVGIPARILKKKGNPS
jgi:UDP-perosamine 4-acetyltransferase